MSQQPPFGTSIRRDPGQPWDLRARIDAEVAARIEEAVDSACLEAMVAARKARSLPLPVAENPRDREEFSEGVRALLERLRAELTAGLPDEPRRETARVTEPAAANPLRELLSIQVSLAKHLPDYWQRFEAVRTRYRDDVVASPLPSVTSGSQRRGLLRRLFRR